MTSTISEQKQAFVRFGRYIGYDKKGFDILYVQWEGKVFHRSNLDELPDYVKEYLSLKRDGTRYIMEGVTTLDQIKECEFVEDLHNFAHNTFYINIDKYKNPNE